MDIDVVLNACFNTHVTNQVSASKKLRKLAKNARTTTLYRNGKSFCNVIEIIINMKSHVEVVTMAGTLPLEGFEVAGRQIVEGRFLAILNSKQMVMVAEDSLTEPYNIKTEQLFNNGDLKQIQIDEVFISDITVYDKSRPIKGKTHATFSYTGVIVENDIVKDLG